MKLVVLLLGILIAAVGLVGIAVPSQLMRLVNAMWRTRRSFYFTAMFRIASGVVLLVAAPDCRFPLAIGVLGIISLIGGLVLPFLGFERTSSFIGWWSSQGAAFKGAWSVIALAVGLFLIYAAAWNG